MAFRNLEYLTAWNGRFDDIKNTINCSLYAACMNLGISLTVETYVYYQFVYLDLRIIHLPLLRIVTRVLDDFLSHHISYTQHDAEEYIASLKLRVGKYLSTCFAKSFRRTILNISTLFEILPHY
jgi:hypothetical protein